MWVLGGLSWSAWRKIAEVWLNDFLRKREQDQIAVAEQDQIDLEQDQIWCRVGRQVAAQENQRKRMQMGIKWVHPNGFVQNAAYPKNKIEMLDVKMGENLSNMTLITSPCSETHKLAINRCPDLFSIHRPPVE